MQLKNVGGFYAVILDDSKNTTVGELIDRILKEKGDQSGTIRLTAFDDSGDFDFVEQQYCVFHKGKITMSNIDENVMKFNIINAFGAFVDHHNTMDYTFDIESPDAYITKPSDGFDICWNCGPEIYTTCEGCDDFNEWKKSNNYK